MASGTINFIPDKVTLYNLTKESSHTFTMLDSSVCVFAGRQNTSVLFGDILDYWSASPQTAFGSRPNWMTYTKSAGSYQFTINNTGSSAVPLIIIGAI